MSETAQVEVASALLDVPCAELPASDVCWHCGGNGYCDCVSCAQSIAIESGAGPCAVCEARSRSVLPKPDALPLAEIVAAGLPVAPSMRTPLDVDTVADPEDFGAEPDWDKYGFRGQVGRLLWARGAGLDDAARLRLQRKAMRFLSCNKCARPGVCSRYPEDHKYFVPNGCEVVFCKECADEVRRELFLAYRDVILAAVLRGIPHGWVFARVTFTLRSDGSEITPERVKRFNGAVRETMKGAVMSAVREQTGPFCSLRKDADGGWKHSRERKGLPDSWFGMLFTDETGFETRGHLPDSRRVAHGLNLHVHGLYFGPRLVWERTRDLWMEATKKKFGVASRGCWLDASCSRSDAGRLWAEKGVTKWVRNNYPAARGAERDALVLNRAVCWALNHMLKYISKPPAVSPERLALLIAAFDGAKRVHSLGLFYGKKPKHEKRDCPCPKCKAQGIVSVIGFEGRQLPNGGCVPRLDLIENLLASGYVPLRKAGRDAVLQMGAPFGGASP